MATRQGGALRYCRLGACLRPLVSIYKTNREHNEVNEEDWTLMAAFVEYARAVWTTLKMCGGKMADLSASIAELSTSLANIKTGRNVVAYDELVSALSLRHAAERSGREGRAPLCRDGDDHHPLHGARAAARTGHGAAHGGHAAAGGSAFGAAPTWARAAPAGESPVIDCLWRIRCIGAPSAESSSKSERSPPQIMSSSPLAASRQPPE